MVLRMKLAYRVIRRVFGQWIAPLFAGLGFTLLRLSVIVGQAIDRLLSGRLRKTELRSPIVIVGNPRTGTTFLQRYLVKSGVGCGQELWRMLYASLTLQVFVRPLLPLLEKISPARHHSTAAHKTSLSSVETDDVSFLFRYFDGFFLYAFVPSVLFCSFLASSGLFWSLPVFSDLQSPERHLLNHPLTKSQQLTC